MKVPVCDLRAGYLPIREQVLKAIDECLDGMQLFLGPNVRAFEEEWAAYCGARRCVGLASGTDALLLLLKACGVGPGDEVITTPFTFFATVEAITHVGATPVFVDIDPHTYCIDASLVEGAVTPQTRAIIPVHLYGHPVDMDPICELARGRGILVLEDGAQAHGAEYRGRRVGSLGDAAAFSFYFTKNLGGYGEGGAVTTDSDEIAQALVELRNHGETSKYVHERMGFNSRLDEIQAAILRIKLQHLDEYNAARRAIAERYRQGLADIGLALPTETDWAKHAYHLYVVLSESRDELGQHLASRDIGYSLHYQRPCHLQEAVKDLGIPTRELPVAEAMADRVIGLPMYPQLSEDQQGYVIRCVRECAVS